MVRPKASRAGQQVTSIPGKKLEDIVATSKAGHLRHLKTLVESGADVNSADSEGFSCLHKAATQNHVPVVQYLLRHGANPEARSRTGWTPLHRAADYGNEEVIEMLLQAGADMDAITKTGRTALQRAVYHQHERAVRVLCLAGADVNVVDGKGLTALQMAVKNANENVIRLLLQREARMTADPEGKTPLHHAVIAGHLRVAAFLLDMGADPNAGDDRDWSPVHYACEQGSIHMMRLLFRNSGEPFKRSVVDGETPLHRAAWSGERVCVKYLVDKGARPNIKNKDGWTPAHNSAWNNKAKALEYLAEAGADLDAPNKEGMTPAMMMPGVGRLQAARHPRPPRGNQIPASARGAKGKAVKA